MEPRTHYQISLTARQAVGIFVGLLLALGLAFFFGLMTGLSGRARHRYGEPAEAAAPSRSLPETLPAVETAVPTARGETVAALATPSGGSAAEPTPPPTLQTFEDGGAEEPPAPATAGAKPEAPAPKTAAGKPPAPGGRVWVQVASVSARADADALSSRLAKRGYHTAIAPDTKGRLRVRVGPYRTTEDARRAAERLHKAEKIKSPWVVFEGK